MILRFVKMHGLGNDFAVFDSRAGSPAPDLALLKRLADRRRGIGFDQALLLEPPREAASTASYRIVNADGSEVQQCGNGARCLALLLAFEAGGPPCELRLDSPAGCVRARVESTSTVAVDMGEPDFRPPALPFAAGGGSAPFQRMINGNELEFDIVSMGNPHAVIWVENVDAADVARVGHSLSQHPDFPERCNVGFAQRLSSGSIRLRVYERGVGETRACGTGACAAVAAGRRHGRLGTDVVVSLPGGELHVSWPGPGQPLWLSGEAKIAFEGKLTL